jgi:hypothetical protein
MAIIPNPVDTKELARIFSTVPVLDNEKNRRAFRRAISRARVGCAGGTGRRPMMLYTELPANEYVPWGEHGRMLVEVRGNIRGIEDFGQLAVLYVVDYKRRVAVRAFVRGESEVTNRILDSVQTIVERRAAQGARLMVGSHPGGW